MLPDPRTFQGVMGTPLASGDSGVAQTIDLIRHLVDDAVKDPEVNSAAIEMVRGASQFDRSSKAQAIYSAVAARFTYVEDPVGPFGAKETLRPVRLLLSQWAGDCDDASTLIASLLGTIGIPSRLVTIAADPTAPEEFSHIYPEAEIFPGVWAAMDVARPGSAFGSAPARYYRKRIWSLSDSSSRDISGRRVSSLAGYAILGDDTSNQLPADLAAAATFESGAAQIISAASGQPTLPTSYATPQNANPYGSFMTPLTPANAAAAAGYPTVSASLSATPLSTGAMWVAALIAAAIIIREMR